LNNGVIRNITDIAFKPNQKQQDAFYRMGINPIVFFQGDGFVVWGQKTLQSKPSAFDRINVRRLFLVLERATLKVMRYFVGEPNTIFTRTRVNNVLKPIFDLAKNNEGCYDYLIVCDERNNTPQVVDNNEMKVDIYIKPVRTAEFILVTFYATRTDQDFNELIG
jgi:phage tail sheath protein FI